jgi:hypothetical protein
MALYVVTEGLQEAAEYHTEPLITRGGASVRYETTVSLFVFVSGGVKRKFFSDRIEKTLER